MSLHLRLSCIILSVGLAISSAAISQTPTDESSHSKSVGRYIVILKPTTQKRSANGKGIGIANAQERMKGIALDLLNRAENQRVKKPGQPPQAHKPHHVFGSALEGFSVDLSDEMLKILRQQPEVETVAVDEEITEDTVQNHPSWGLDRIDQRSLPLNQQYRYTRTGIGVHAYVLDSGILSSHQEFTGRIGNGFDFIENDANPQDCRGHGTLVSSLLAGKNYGVAKQAIIHPVKVLPCKGETGYVSTLIAGIDWIKVNHIKPAVVNISLSASGNHLKYAINSLIQNDISVVVSAGNNHQQLPTADSLACIEPVITVGSSDEYDHISSFSAIGGCLDIYAPGQYLPGAHYESVDGMVYGSGTSLSSPYVAGVIAQYLQTHSTSSAQSKLLRSASYMNDSYRGTGTVKLLYSSFSPPRTESTENAAIKALPAILNLLLSD